MVSGALVHILLMGARRPQRRSGQWTPALTEVQGRSMDEDGEREPGVQVGQDELGRVGQGHPELEQRAGGPGTTQLRLVDQIAMAIRAHRRALRVSQRAWARAIGISAARVARMESDPLSQRVDSVVALLELTGHRLAVVDGAGRRVDDEAAWPEVERAARDRLGRRFPAHRDVRESTGGPIWWWYHEVLGGRRYGPQPRWTAEGFPIPPGTRYGKEPRPPEEGELTRWPH